MVRRDRSAVLEPTTTWRLIVDDRPRSGVENMAIDGALFERVQAGGRPFLRLYRWDPPCLSLGRNQPLAGPDVARAAAAAGIELVRRPTGGQAVLHDRELTYSVGASVATLGSPRSAYRAINRALVAGLRPLGAPAEVAQEARRVDATADWAAPCFDAAAPGEVVVGGRKLIGSAQRCERRTLLQHGSILLDGDQREVAALLGGTARSGREPAVANLRDVLGYVPPWDALVASLADGFAGTLGIRMERAVPDPDERDRAHVLEARFRSDAWTGRR